MMEFSIRKIGPEDRSAFLKMSRDFYHSPAVLHDVPERYHEDAFAELMRSDRYLDCRFFEGADGTVIGYVLLMKTYTREAGGLTVWVDELYVCPEWQGQGVAHRFFSWLEQNIPAARYRLETEPENVRAKALYERMGYVPLPYQQMIRDMPETVQPAE